MKSAGWDGNLGRERYKLKSYKHLRVACAGNMLREGRVLPCGYSTVGKRVESLSEPDPGGHYMPCTCTWTLSCQQYPTECSVIMEILYFVLSNMVATSPI